MYHSLKCPSSRFHVYRSAEPYSNVSCQLRIIPGSGGATVRKHDRTCSHHSLLPLSLSLFLLVASFCSKVEMVLRTRRNSVRSPSLNISAGLCHLDSFELLTNSTVHQFSTFLCICFCVCVKLPRVWWVLHRTQVLAELRVGPSGFSRDE